MTVAMSGQILTLTVLLSVFFASLTAYDSINRTFNTSLVEDLERLESGLEENRSRRDASNEERNNGDNCRSWRKKKYCCAQKSIEESFEKIQETKRQCQKQLFGNETTEFGGESDGFRCENIGGKHRKDMTCLAQCVGQKENILDEDGNVKSNELKDRLGEVMSEEVWFGAIAEEVIETCLSEWRNATAKPASNRSCNPSALKVAHCLFREIQLRCPADQIKDQRICSRIRDRIKRRHNGPTHNSDE